MLLCFTHFMKRRLIKTELHLTNEMITRKKERKLEIKANACGAHTSTRHEYRPLNPREN